jgi:hypothetical protein
MKKGKMNLLDKEISLDLSKIFLKHQIYLIEIIKDEFLSEFQNADYISQKMVTDFFDSRIVKLKTT